MTSLAVNLHANATAFAVRGFVSAAALNNNNANSNPRINGWAGV